MDFVSKNYFVQKEAYNEFFQEDGQTLRYFVWEQALAKVDKTKTPGSPMVYVSPKNMGLINYDAEMHELVENRLLALEDLGRQVWETKEFESKGLNRLDVAKALIAQRLTDPVLVGIKGEPRKLGKAPRLVSQVSVLTNLVARFIIGNHLLEEQKYANLPTVTQLDLTTPEKTEDFRRGLMMYGQLNSSDVQGWEYSVTSGDRWGACFKEAYCMGLIDKNWQLTGGDHYENKHFYALVGYHYCMINRVVQLPEGQLILPPSGQMSSGELGTFSENSFMRAYLSDLVSRDTTGNPVRYVKTGGDDALDTNARNDEAYFKYGKVITDYTPNMGTYNFCSTTFKEEGSYQDNIEKSVYAICKKRQFNDEDRLAFDACFAKHPRYSECLSVVENFLNSTPAE